MYIILSKHLDPDYVREILEEVDNKQPDTLSVYIDAPGGEIPSKDMLVDFFNTINANGVTVTLIASGVVASSALFLFEEANCSKAVLPNASGLLHKINQGGMNSIDKGNTYWNDLIKEVEKNNEELLNKYRHILNEEQIFDFNHGLDVYLTAEDLKKLVKIT